MDLGGAEVARPFVERAKPTHPSLVDPQHRLADWLGFVNVPTSAWIDESGMLVRIGDTAANQRNKIRDVPINDDMPERLREMLSEVRKIQTDHEDYLAALRDWAEQGAASRFALPPEEVVARARPRPPEVALAAANFEMAQHLQRAGQAEDAIPYFRESHRLQPDNWTYKRQAWSLVDPNQGPTEHYEGDWLGDVKKLGGGESYYPRFRP